MAEDRGSWLSIATGMFVGWSCLIFSVRVWAKLRTKHWGVDDYTISTALALSIAQVAVTFRAIDLGYGQHAADIPEQQLDKVKMALFASQLLYIITVGLCRLSASFFIARMTYFGPQTRPAYILATLSFMWMVGSVFAVAIRGDLSKPWDVLDGSQIMYTRWVGVEGSGLGIEVALWALSAYIVWGLQMKLQKRLFILSAFGVRLMLVPIIVFRLRALLPERNDDPTITTVIPNILMEASLHFSILASCITSLKPFLRSFNHPVFTVKSTGTKSSGRNGTRDSYYRLETFRRYDRSGGISSGGVSNDSANWRPFEGSVEGHATAFPQRSHIRSDGRHLMRGDSVRQAKNFSRKTTKDDGDSADTDASDRLIIQRTTEVSVQYEPSPQRGKDIP